MGVAVYCGRNCNRKKDRASQESNPRLLPVSSLGTTKNFRKLVRILPQNGLILWATKNKKESEPWPLTSSGGLAWL